MSKFRNSSGKHYLKAMFYEEAPDPREAILYTLKREDHLGYPSLYRLYIETGDPTEYKFAQQYLDGWYHWGLLSAQAWFAPYLLEWRSELEVRVRSNALDRIIQVSQEPNHGSAFTANRFLLEGNWKPTQGKGRPRKEDIRKAAQELAEARADFDDDFKRIGLQ